MACVDIIADGSSCNPFLHDPQAVLDYVFPLTAFLAGDTISSYTLTSSNITIDSDSLSGDDITVWVSGGILYKTATVTCHIVTAQGRQEDFTMYFKIVEK